VRLAQDDGAVGGDGDYLSHQRPLVLTEAVLAIADWLLLHPWMLSAAIGGDVFRREMHCSSEAVPGHLQSSYHLTKSKSAIRSLMEENLVGFDKMSGQKRVREASRRHAAPLSNTTLENENSSPTPSARPTEPRGRPKKIDGPPRTLTQSQTHPPTIRLFFFP
jgi:hypothetical protein